ncbi:DUF1800 family protein [Marinigracilibium pacificum]|uniref:DUF1800 domain-containing protein n=1 Tax=Marinigracilibium pacificum TaxID=2729599 RepID=A0A848IZS4_9BACT|nr:DUF1800 family protein [Marinigracilibium pacificum]NMM47800.1 DUF1800 domain-containing protein [Marinigracilibium pacificum]
MKPEYLASLRVGFSTDQAPEIKRLGIERYINKKLNNRLRVDEPGFIANSPKTFKELQSLKSEIKKNENESDKVLNDFIKLQFQWKSFMAERYFNSSNVLHEKINLFFQNHFVVTLKSVKVPYWIYLHYKSINDHSLENYKDLVREMVYSNAMIRYLDNQKNRKDNINENFARELLELFTLGEGNYTEDDIKNVARSLAGLSPGQNRGIYRPKFTDNSIKTFLGETGNFKADDLIEIIFKNGQPAKFLTQKILKWFFYDNPEEEMIIYYSEILVKNNYELKPFFEKLFVQECNKGISGTKIKDPLTFIVQIHKDLNIMPNYLMVSFFLREQGMDIYDQPNVKGWSGGQEWLTTQLYTNRKQLLDMIVFGRDRLERSISKRLSKFDAGPVDFSTDLVISNLQSANDIIKELTDRMVFETNEEMDIELKQVLPYDFNPEAENADKKILNVYRYLGQCPEFQII